MDKFIVIRNEKADLKNIYVSETGIKALDTNLETKDNFVSSFANTSNGTLDTKDDINFDSINSISTFNDDFGLQIKYIKKNDKKETSYLEFDNLEDLTDIKNYIISKSKLALNKPDESNKKSLQQRWIIAILVILTMGLGYKYLDLPKFSLYIMLAISGGVLFWVRLAQEKSEIEEERYIK